jgi:hypothetical protein
MFFRVLMLCIGAILAAHAQALVSTRVLSGSGSDRATSSSPINKGFVYRRRLDQLARFSGEPGAAGAESRRPAFESAGMDAHFPRCLSRRRMVAADARPLATDRFCSRRLLAASIAAATRRLWALRQRDLPATASGFGSDPTNPPGRLRRLEQRDDLSGTWTAALAAGNTRLIRTISDSQIAAQLAIIRSGHRPCMR